MTRRNHDRMRKAAIFVYVVALCACSNDEGARCQPSSATLVVVVRGLPEDTIVTASRACADLRCSNPEEAGCSNWRGAITGQPGDSCSVFAAAPDGRPLASKTVQLGTACGGVASATVEF